MGCCNGSGTAAMRKVTLEFYREELEKDIAQIGYVNGDVTEAGAVHSKHQIQDIVEDGNRERVIRMLGLAHGEVLEMLYSATNSPVDDGTTDDNVYEEPEKYVVNMTVPETFSLTTVKYLREAIHEYMICRALEDWMGIARDPGQVEIWAARRDQAQKNIMKAMAKRGGRLRLRLTPF